jgi:RND superfamily putative drug exporter
LGRAVDRPRVPVLWRLTNRADRPARLWPMLLRPALRRPGITFLLSLAAMLALAAPALQLRLHTSGPQDLPSSIPAVAAYDRLTAEFPSKGAEHVIAVRAPAAQAAQVTAALQGLERSVQRNPLFAARVAGSGVAGVGQSTDGQVHTLTIATPYPVDSAPAKRSLSQLRAELLPNAFRQLPAARYAVGGDVADNVDNAVHSRDKLPWVMGFVLLFTFVIMTVTFRSVVVAVTAIAINLLSACSAFGILVLVFQGDWAQRPLGFANTGVIGWIPIFLFVVLFGLSMDYHVFVVSRIAEGVDRGLSTRDAVREGIVRSAGVVTSAAIVMVSVFAVFATLSLVEFKQLGIGLSVAVLLDVLVVRIVLLPSLMLLLGRWNWWPGRRSAKQWQGQLARPTAGDPYRDSPVLTG